VELLSECHPLLEQLGSADGLFTLGAVAASLRLPKVDSHAALAEFLRAYRRKILLPLEWPAIFRAHHHASRNEARELIALDMTLSREKTHRHFASASRRVGRGQLQRLRPLRDERIVQRYLLAVEQEQAQAWHTLVYGLTLAIYSLPVRQGLLNYAHQTFNGFIRVSARPLQLSAIDCKRLLEQAGADLNGRLEAILKTGKSAERTLN
jgi:urease accessory protein UreF